MLFGEGPDGIEAANREFTQLFVFHGVSFDASHRYPVRGVFSASVSQSALF